MVLDGAPAGAVLSSRRGPGRLPVLWLLLLLAPLARAGVTVEIEGVEGEVLANVRAFLGIVGRDLGDASADRVRRLHARAPNEIRAALEPFGYYAPGIDARLERTADGWRAVYRIRPGERVRLEAVRVRVTGEARDDPAFGKLLGELALEPGQPLNHADYEKDKQRLMELAAERGYVEARWTTSALRIQPDRLRAEAELVLASGPRYRFGSVRFAQTRLAEGFLQRYVPFDAGDPFDARQLRRLQFALDDSDYFERVDVRARRREAAGGRIPVAVDLALKPKHRLRLGVGFGTDTGARATIARDTRYFNDRGHKLTTELQLAQISTRVTARYTIPLAEPWRERLELNTSLAEEEIGDGTSEQLELGARRVTTSGGWQRTLSLRYQRSRDDIGGETTTRDLVIPGASFTRSVFDQAIYATRGHRFTIDFSGGAETLGSDVSFLRMRADTRAVRAVWDGGRVLLRGELGRVWVDDFEDLPLSQRFFAGGDDSVRGFDFQELGPRNDAGETIGGRYLAVASIELEQMIAGKWGAAVFADAGNAFNDTSTDLRTSLGVGLRYKSPVGMFRVDVAQPTDGDESVRLHLSLGVDL